jgi:predicted nucleic acid-binding protein
MKVYVDSSVVLRRLLREPGAFERWSDWEWVVSSELLLVEAHRSINRLRLTRSIVDEEVAQVMAVFRSLTRAFEMIPIRAPVLERAASAFPTVVGTLDAIHIASALLWVQENEAPLVFLTHDEQQARAAMACGLDVQTAP